MAGFSKLFSSLWGGSLYGRFEASAVFMVVLSLCDHNGVIDMTPEAIAGTTGWPVDFIRKGLGELVAPDKRSRTPDHGGCRLRPLDDHREWGWSVTNYAKYRDQMRSIERREYLKEAKRKERAKKRESVNMSTTVNRCRPITDTEAEAYNGSTNVDPAVWAEFTAHRKAIRKPLSKLSAQKNINILAALSPEQQRQAVDTTIANNWTGIFPPKEPHGNHQGSGRASAPERVRAAAAKRESAARAAGEDY